jgi:hypothetical protein
VTPASGGSRFRWWWADPLSALLIVGDAVREAKHLLADA